VSSALYAKAALIVACVALFAWAAFYAAPTYGLALVAAALLGVAMAEVGISIQHDANHGAFCR